MTFISCATFVLAGFATLAAGQTSLPEGSVLDFTLTSGTAYVAPSGCRANFSITGGTGGNAVLGIGGGAASFNFSAILPAGVPVYALVGSAATGCAVTYCSSGGGAASALLLNSLSNPTFLAIAAGGGGSSTTVTQIGGAGGPPGGNGATGTTAAYGGIGGTQTSAGAYAGTQTQYSGIGCCIAACAPGACAGAGNRTNGGRGGGAAAAVCNPGGTVAALPTWGAGGCGWTYVTLAGGGGGGGGYFGGGGGACGSLSFQSGGGGGSSFVNVSEGVVALPGFVVVPASAISGASGLVGKVRLLSCSALTPSSTPTASLSRGTTPSPTMTPPVTTTPTNTASASGTPTMTQTATATATLTRGASSSQSPGYGLILPTGTTLSMSLANLQQYRAPASGCVANFTVQGASGGNALLALGGNGASFTVTISLGGLAPVFSSVGSGGVGCSITYCGSGGGGSTGLFADVVSATTPAIYAIAGGGGGSSTTTTQVGGSGGPPGGSGATGTAASYGGFGGTQTAAGSYGTTQAAYSGLAGYTGGCTPGTCDGAGNGRNGGQAGHGIGAVCNAGGNSTFLGTAGCGYSYISVASGGGGGAGWYGGGGGAAGSTSFQSGGGGGSSYVNTGLGASWSNYVATGQSTVSGANGPAGFVVLTSCVTPPTATSSVSNGASASQTMTGTPAGTPSGTSSNSPTPSLSTGASASKTPGLGITLPQGSNLNYPLINYTLYNTPALSPGYTCAASFTISGAAGGNAQAVLGGNGAAFNVSVNLPGGFQLVSAVATGGTGCNILYCGSGGGGATALYTGYSPSSKSWLLAIAGGGGGSSTTSTQVGGDAGPPGGSGTQGTATAYGGLGGTQTNAGSYGATQSAYTGLAGYTAGCTPGTCDGAGNGNCGGMAGHGVNAVPNPGGFSPGFCSAGSGFSYISVASGGGGGAGWFGGGGGAAGSLSFQSGGGGGSSWVNASFGVIASGAGFSARSLVTGDSGPVGSVILRSMICPSATPTPSLTTGVSSSTTSSITASSTSSMTAAVTGTPSNPATLTTTPTTSLSVGVSASMSAAVSLSPSAVATTTQTPSNSLAPLITPSNTPAVTVSASAAETQTTTPTNSLAPGISPSGTPASTVSGTAATTQSTTPTSSLSSGASISSSSASTPEATPSPGGTPSATVTVSSSGSQSPTMTPSSTMSISLTISATPSISVSPNCLTGYVSTLAGYAGSDPGYADGIGTAAKFNSPQGTTATSDGNVVYVTDTGNNRIRSVTTATGATTNFVGVGFPGWGDGTGTNIAFSAPTTSCLSVDGLSLFIADTSNGRIRKAVIASKSVTTIAGSGGIDGGLRDGVGTAAMFNQPTGIAADATTIYVVDSGNNALRSIVIATRVVTTLAGQAGRTGFADGVGTSALFSASMWGLALGADGVLFVADGGNAAVRLFTLATGSVSSPVFSAPLVPVGLAINANNDNGQVLYVANASTNTIAQVLVRYNYATSVLAGIVGVASSDDGRLATFNGPRGVTLSTVNGHDVITVADTGNNNVRTISCGSFFSPAATSSSSSSASPSLASPSARAADVDGQIEAAKSNVASTAGAIGGAIGGVIFLGIVGAIVFLTLRRMRRRGAKAVVAASQRQNERALKDALASEKAEKAALEAQLAALLKGHGGGASPTLGGAPDALNAGFNPMAARAASLRSLTKVDSPPLHAQGTLSSVSTQQASLGRGGSGLLRAPSVSDVSTARTAVGRTSSGRAIPTPMAPRVQSALHSAVWSPEHSAYYFVNKKSGAAVWEITDAAEIARIRAEAKAAGLSPLPFDETPAGAAAAAAQPAAAYTATWSADHNAYYFVSKTTGEAVWELSDEEMARVRAEAAAAGLSPLP